ncbi:N-acetylglucosamine kinase of eukaryotic type [Acidisarcina polymorpha]|uniref:N-acetylglucosamine kinase of eukaryotic type n=1 Tax=Acidisarcina polymorpha TaxID=2211140 RepID=A0A2Z5G2E1_9BACT|nr:BadF/BadG/BcrA/BcrD ATPase family protein [Acidisarcina polymorpha]AXC12857.1 N-acetylglucosamine kinase of eukaryotic type [Acidisarcina polymorpha]
MAYYLGIDGGGTKTDFLLAEEDRELGRVRTGSIKVLRLDAATTGRNLYSALNELTSLTGVSMRKVTRCCIGAGGVAVPTAAAWIRSTFAELIGGELMLVGDVEIALDAAFRGQRGVLILAGTGSQIAGRGNDGVFRTVGGYGPILSDEGSGHFLGVEGLRRSFRAIDEERPTQLLDSIRRHWKLSSPEEVVEFASQNLAPDFSQLAPLVVECAVSGDAVAAEVVRDGGRHLAELATLMIERLRRVEGSRQEDFVVPPVALAGSILTKVALARQALAEALGARYPGIVISETATDPVQGALWRARRGS